LSDLHVTEWGDGDRIVLVHGSLRAGVETWSAQRPLASDYRLVVVDRRGFGDSPPGHGDFDRDARDVAELLEAGDHVVGHSYGAVVALLAAARRPQFVRSLTVIEPPALGLVRGRPEVEEFIERVDAARREAVDAPDYVVRFRRAFGARVERRVLAGRELKAANASWQERAPTEATIPVAELAAAPFRTLVVRGAWDVASSDARRIARPALHAVCDVLVERLGADAATLPGAGHAAQLSPAFNERLRVFLDASSPSG